MPIKSFRGKIPDEGIDTIVLHTNNGSTGYKIVKLELMVTDPTTTDGEHVVKVFTIPQTTASKTIDFSDQTLIAAGHIDNDNNARYNPLPSIVFDNVVFNQDIFITHTDEGGSSAINYHIELEQIKLDLNENTVATLKDIRNIDAQFDTVIN
tara:strand:- start:470 stop:925 length:456 start_codon:yes stop_codon:yes gene_type:complete